MAMTANDELKSIIEKRNEYFRSIEEEELKNMDDDEIRRYMEFKKRYEQLSVMERDLWFLDTQIKKVEIARLYGVSKPYISKLIKQIKEKLL